MGKSKRRGSQELPDRVQDRPEQNEGYDAAVRGSDVPPGATKDETTVLNLTDEPELSVNPTLPGEAGPRPSRDVDDRAVREAIGEVRRRERSTQ